MYMGMAYFSLAAYSRGVLGAVLPRHVDVSSNQEWDRESERESSYSEETGYKINWEKLS